MATKKEKPAKSLELTLWEACDKLRSNMSGISYMYFVMGLVFLKFANMKFEKRREELLASEDAEFVEMAAFYEEKGVFFIPGKASVLSLLPFFYEDLSKPTLLSECMHMC